MALCIFGNVLAPHSFARTPIFSILILCIGNFKRFSAFYASPLTSARVLTFRLAFSIETLLLAFNFWTIHVHS